MLPVEARRSDTVSADPKSQYLAPAHSYRVSLVDVETDAQRWELEGLNGNVADISRDVRHLVSASTNDDVPLRYIHNGRLVKVLRSLAVGANCVAFAPGGQGMASSDGSGKVMLWACGNV